MTLRPYQQDAVDAAIDHVRKCVDPCLIRAPTGAGKSHIVAAIGQIIHSMSKKKILVIAPSAELVEQNHEKYLHTGNPASIYSASVRKEMNHPVVFGTPQTVANSLHKFGGFAAVIVDEAHRITATLRKIIDHLRKDNGKLRIIGLTATPYRMGTGYIYACHYERGYLSEDETRDPYFERLVYDIDERMLIDDGYLTRPLIGDISEHYDTSALEQSRTGDWTAESVDRAFVGQGRLTSAIIAEIVERSRQRKGVMIFAATVQHARECLDSLPPEISAIVTGETPKPERAAILKAFKARKIKYLVNVAVLTTGFDAPHVDVVALLRATDSASLLQQIVGRGLRIDPDKTDCLVLDYAENIERHCPNGDIFDPEIKVKGGSKGEPVPVTCPECNHINEFAARPNPDRYEVTDHGYFADLRGQMIMDGEDRPIPSHFGRRCTGYVIAGGIVDRCTYKWSYKECPDCGHENDIAARFCSGCRAELVDPNEKLQIEAARLTADPYATKVEDMLGMSMERWPGKDGKPDTLRLTFTTATGIDVSHWFAPESGSAWIRSKWHQFCAGVWGHDMDGIDAAIDARYEAEMPTKIAYRRKRGSKYYEMVGLEYVITE